MTADGQIRARVEQKILNEIKEIAKIINEENPGAGATISTITKFALKQYTDDFWKKRKEKTEC